MFTKDKWLRIFIIVLVVGVAATLIIFLIPKNKTISVSAKDTQTVVDETFEIEYEVSDPFATIKFVVKDESIIEKVAGFVNKFKAKSSGQTEVEVVASNDQTSKSCTCKVEVMPKEEPSTPSTPAEQDPNNNKPNENPDDNQNGNTNQPDDNTNQNDNNPDDNHGDNNPNGNPDDNNSNNENEQTPSNPDEQNPDGQKPEEKEPEEHKPEEKEPDTQKPDEKEPDEQEQNPNNPDENQGQPEQNPQEVVNRFKIFGVDGYILEVGDEPLFITLIFDKSVDLSQDIIFKTDEGICIVKVENASSTYELSAQNSGTILIYNASTLVGKITVEKQTI